MGVEHLHLIDLTPIATIILYGLRLKFADKLTKAELALLTPVLTFILRISLKLALTLTTKLKLWYTQHSKYHIMQDKLVAVRGELKRSTIVG